MAGASDMLKKLMPNALIDAAVSRQLVPTIGLFNQYKNQGALAENVLIGLGTNGPFSMDDINHLMEIIYLIVKSFGLVSMFQVDNGRPKLMN